MCRLLAAALVAVMAGVAVADIPPPPPPKGKKYVNVASEVKLAKDVTGYVFVSERSNTPGRPVFSYKKLELSPDKTVAISDGGRRAFDSLVAIPQDAAKEFKTDAELFAAVEGNKLKGTHRLRLSGSATVPDTIKGDTVKWTYTVSAIDDKGIKATVEGEGYEPPKPKKGDAKEPPKEDDDSSDLPPELYRCGTEPDLASPLTARGGPVVAGVAAGAALTFGGLWLVGRGRRKV